MSTQPTLILCELEATPLPGLESFSPFCMKAHRALKSAGLAYTSRHAARPDAHRRENGTGQVPVLLVDGKPVPDSTNILHAIAELRPDAWDTSAEAWLWEDYADTALNGFLVAARWADARNWPATRRAYFHAAPWPVRALVTPMLRRGIVRSLHARDVWRAGPEACWARFEQTLGCLDARAPVAGFWLGERLSVADLGLFAQLRGLMTPLTAWQSERVLASARLSAYLARVDAVTRGSASPSTHDERGEEEGAGAGKRVAA